MTGAERVRWGLLGTGAVARLFAEELPMSRTGELYGAAGRSLGPAQAFATEHGAATSYGSYQELLDDDAVDAVYIATVHSTHAELAIQAVEAGRHVLVEKPLGVTAAQASGVVDAARRHGVFLAEANIYRYHPQTALLRELIADGAIGEVHAIEASCGYIAEPYPTAREFDVGLGGGAILGVGGYPVSMARLVAGVAAGQPFAEPQTLSGVGTVGDTGVDEWAVATLRFPYGIIARVSTGVRAGDENVVRVYGSRGHLFVPLPWVLPADEPGTVVLTTLGAGRQTLHSAPAASYAREADALGLRGEAVEAAEVSWADSLGTAAVLDQWRAALGPLTA